MPTIIDARNSQTVRRMQQEVPVLRASTYDEAFIGFITEQACKPSGAAVVVRELEGREQSGFRLDRTLTQVLKMARATMARLPALANAFH